MTYQTKSYIEALLPRPPRKYLVDKIIPERSFTGFYGPPGGLKSSVVLDMALAVSTGKNFLSSMPMTASLFPGHKTFQVPVLWIDIDNGEDITAERVAAFGKSYNADRSQT